MNKRNYILLTGILIILISVIVFASINNELEGNCIIVNEIGSQENGIEAECPAGYLVTGGGWKNYEGDDEQVSSYPTSNGWYCEGSNSENAECYAVCCDESLISTEILSKTSGDFSDELEWRYVECPENTSVLGGGFSDCGNNDDMDTTRPVFTEKYNGWWTWEDHPNEDATNYAVCGGVEEDYELSCKVEEVIGNQEDGVSVFCSDNYIMVSGGFLDLAGNNDFQEINMPIENGWYCQEDSSSDNSICYAVCCSLQLTSECSQDSDCGEISEELICKDGDAYNKIITPTCLNNNCGENVEYILEDECEEDEKCRNGECKKKSDDKKKRIDYCGDDYCDSEIGEDEFTCPTDCEFEFLSFRNINYGSTEPLKEDIKLEGRVQGKSYSGILIFFLLLILFLLLLIIIVYFLRR